MNASSEKMRRSKAKSHTCSFHIPIWNENNYEVIPIKYVIVICIKRLESGRRKRADREAVKIQR